jgi:hypothetical protein
MKTLAGRSNLITGREGSEMSISWAHRKRDRVEGRYLLGLVLPVAS